MKKREKTYQFIIVLLLAVVGLQLAYISSLRRAAVVKIAGPQVKPPPISYKGKIAIVLDDWGYNLNNVNAVRQIKLPLTISVLPNLAYSKEVAKQLHASGLEIMIHLPMEPQERYRLEENTILTSMSEKKIRGIIQKDLTSVPFARGVNNHMGSKATSEGKVMMVILGELKKKNLYFLDSLVTGDTVCARIAANLGMPFAKRDIFLDNHEDPAYITKQIEKLKTKARMNGQAIGIGHDRKTTLSLLREVLPQLEKEGYKLVFVSELVK